MTDCSTFKISATEWVKMVGLVMVHSALLFSSLAFWANRIVAVEVRVMNIEAQLASGLVEVRADIKELLQRTKK